MTGRQMCEAIAERIRERTGRVVDPKEIWEASPSGEVWPVFAMYDYVVTKDRLAPKERSDG